ncbi:MAG: right-handed parallel beta-helix repeat-containing protein [Anaerolineae bacterium]|nr:right-handed parallel beta-helix repeat-containing protein [Anaerolineae bacterium]
MPIRLATFVLLSVLMASVTLFLSPQAAADTTSNLPGPATSLQTQPALSSNEFFVYLPFIEQHCFAWSEQISLQAAVDEYGCVEIQPGEWTTNRQISLKAGHELRGRGQDTTVLRAGSPWIGNGTRNDREAVVHSNGSVNVKVSNFTIDAANLSTFGLGANGMTIQFMTVKNALCDGIAIAGPGMVIEDSIIEDNGYHCHSGVAGSGIYAVKSQENILPARYMPHIRRNTIRHNGGPALDVDRVWGGVFEDNIVHDNAAWTAVSLYSASEWTVATNEIHHPFDADPLQSNHPACWGGPFGNHPAGLAICQDSLDDDKLALRNLVRDNYITGWYGIKTVGNDEMNILEVPRYNTFQANNVLGSYVGCIDDFEPTSGASGLNSWTNNNCNGRPDSLPLYFMVLCPSAIRRSTVEQWRVGEVDVSVVEESIARFNRERTGGGAFEVDAAIPNGVIVATNYEEAGYSWNQFPVVPLVHYRSYGLFETTGQYNAPQAGACLTIVP